jgi:VanZ family protein
MMQASSELQSLRALPFVVASLVSAILVLSAPFVGRIRGQIRSAFPGQFVAIVGGAIALAIGAALLLALWRIRERRRLRYMLLAVSLAAGVAYSYAIRTGNPEVDVVEHFHFVSYGLVTLLFYRAWRPLGDAAVFLLPVLSALMVGALDEWFQWFLPNRIGELRDIFLNAAAIAVGLVFSLGLHPPHRFTWSAGPASRVRVRRMIAATVVVLAAFVSIVHLGHQVTDGERTFRSIYSARELDELSADRAVTWRDDPPIVLRRLSAEDQYVSEGLWHVQRRNRAWQAEDARTAFEENLILERFFTPVLDTPSYVSRSGHRWSPPHRADAEGRARQAGTRGPYVSDAHLYPIFTWPASWFWVLVAALAIVAWGPRRPRRVDSRRESQPSRSSAG